MPTYLYLCEVCNEEFEEYHSISKKLDSCPICKGKELPDHEPKRLINGGGSGRGIVELTGQEYKDKIKADTEKLKKEVYSSEKTYSNILGEKRYNDIQTSLDRGRRGRR